MWIVFALAGGACVAGVAALPPVPARTDVASGRAATVFSEEAGGYRYEYHALTGRECLLRTGDEEPRDVSAEHPQIVAALRRALAARLGVRSLEDLRGGHADAVERLSALGYL